MPSSEKALADAPLAAGEAHVKPRILAAQEFRQNRRDHILRGKMSAFNQVQSQLSAVDPLVVPDLSGDHRVM